MIIKNLNPLKKEVRNEVETSEKIWGYVAGEGEFENNRTRAPGAPEKGPKNKTLWKSIGSVLSGGSIIIRVSIP